MNGYGKFYWIFLMAVLSAVGAALTDGHINTEEWVNIGLIGSGSALTIIVPNLNAGVAKYAKLFCAGLTAALTLLVTLIDGGVSGSEWIQLILAVAGAVGVGAFPAPQYTLQVAKPVTPA